MTNHRFPWNWQKSDLDNIQKNGKKVLSCFACGGGSSFGYKLAGYEVLGNVEIDPNMNEIYVKNHHPKYNYNMDIRDFNRLPLDSLPDELFELDILDGSPPCTPFSMSGDREKTWGKEKKFAEGQQSQILDTLFFDFIDTAKRLKPKVIVAENVKGLLLGKAKKYVTQIIKGFDDAGYVTQLFLLDASKMGVPQKRERVVFIARKKELNLPNISLFFNERPIPFGMVRERKATPISASTHIGVLTAKRRPGDRGLKDVVKRYGIESGYLFNHVFFADNRVASTLTATGSEIRMCDGARLTHGDRRNVSTFPQDYIVPEKKAAFVYGMSVPPVMMAHIAAAIYEQWLSKI